ncbi:MAG TPA: S53 family peptidase [Streptosporangiales bacterium]
MPTRTRARRLAVLAAAGVAAVAAMASAAPAVAAGPSAGPTGTSVTPPSAAPSPGSLGTEAACGLPSAGHAACFAVLDRKVHWTGRRWALGTAPKTRPRTAPKATGGGLHPYLAADLQDAYRLPSALLGARQTIAIVDAFDDPNAERDLAVYREANGLPPCDADFPCFRKVDQRGGTDYPTPDANWSVEISLDLDMASAACPNCELLLVEADDNGFDSLMAAVDTAVRLGADVVSNSYGGPEWPGTSDDDLAEIAKHYDHDGVVITASSGDAGFGVSVPAAFGSVVAVGGTSLYRDGGRRGWAEDAWSGAGSGCSAYVAKPPWQRDGLCDTRTVADVSAVADPTTPVAVYDTYGLEDGGGWVAVGGTSASAPLVAGIYALAGNARDIAPARYLYSHRAALFDVSSGFEGGPGSNGYCGGSYLCTAVHGYDGPTGNGSPNGIGAF